MCFRFPNCNNTFVQTFNSPIFSFRTVKTSLQPADSFRKYFCPLNNVKNSGCRHPLATDVQNIWLRKQCEVGNKNSKSKVKSTEPTLFQKLVWQKFENTEAWNLKSDVYNLKNTGRSTIQIYSNFFWSFSANSHYVHDKALTTKQQKNGERHRIRYQSAVEKKKRNLENFFTCCNIFQPLWTMKDQPSVFCKFPFYIPNTFRLWKTGAWKKF